MKKDIKDYFNKAKLLHLFKKLKKIPWVLAKDAFLFILIFILLDIVFGEYLFYRHVISGKTRETVVTDVTVNFKENLYRSVLKEMQNRQLIFENPTLENYKSPFLPTLPSVPASQEKSLPAAPQ